MILETCHRKRYQMTNRRVPPQENELHDGNADEHVPVAGGGQLPASTWHGIPGRGVERDPTVPKPEADRVDSNHEPDLHRNGIAQPDCRIDGTVKSGQVLRQNDTTLDKAPHNRTQSQVHDQLRSDENRKCHEESDMHLDVAKEGEATSTPTRGAERGEE